MHRRRERIGVTLIDLARLAGINRDTVAAIEEGKGFRRDSLTKIERALTELEVEHGLGPIEAPEEESPRATRNVVITLGEGRGRVVVEGPVEDLVELEAAAERLFRLGESH